ncbi:branched-chain amino acid ABC transporter substrate-binding protein [Deinococcus hohokamensis]|uniref:Branched-chain amino acid ABC transporter substrate-binding protein n=1 Tax=Deinococcus hohokamensis TaxID=309883 RepID=A0ABV9I874_9DEIO
MLNNSTDARRRARGLVSLAAGLLLAGTAQAATFKIATISPLSGDLSAIGQEIRRATELAIRDQAAAFRTLGHSVVLVPFDDQGAPTVAAQEIKRVLADPGILGVVGAYNSAVSNVVGQATAPARLAVISPASSNDALTTQGWTQFHRLVPPDQAHAVAALNYITGELKARSVYVVSDNTGYGNGLTRAIIAEMKKRQVTLAGYVGVSSDEDAEAALRKIKASGPGVVFCGCYENVLAPMIKGLRAAQVPATFMGAGTLDSPSFVRRVGVDAEGAVYTTGFGPISSFTNSQAFASKYRAAYNVVPSGVAAYAYDAATTLLTALRTAASAAGGVPSRPQVSQALRRTSLPACFGGTTSNCTTVSGAISFTNTGDRQRSRLLVMRFDKLLQPQVAKVYTISPEANR